MRARYANVLIGQLADIRSYLFANCDLAELAPDCQGQGPLAAAFDALQLVPKFFAIFSDAVSQMDSSRSSLDAWTTAWTGVVTKSCQLDRAVFIPKTEDEWTR
eukprot:7422114-Pyramimonas_sp.AAC.1